MCGINGIINYSEKVDLEDLCRMNNAISYRGPDDEGIFLSKDKSVGFGNRRLSIVDIKDGAQPLIYEHGAEQYAITFNGEIYNHNSLRTELERKGYKFKTRCDTEVLLTSYIEWGKDCLKKLNGQFAFAVYDGKARKVFIARDRLGIKPLYYANNHTNKGNSFLFSSEPKGILAHSQMSREPDYETIANYFIAMMTLVNAGAPPERSFYQGISALPPATYAFLDEKGLQSPEQYWQLPFPKKSPEARLRGCEAVDALRAALEESVKIRIPNDVSFATALSGGLDSSIITILSLQYARNVGNAEKLTSATIGFLDDPDYRHAKLLAEQKGIRLLNNELTAEKMIEGIDELVNAFDEPHNTVRQLGLMNVLKTLSNEGFKVALVGEGSDEALLGYFNNSPGFAVDKAFQNPEILRRGLFSRAEFVGRYFSNSFLTHVDLKRIAEQIFSFEYNNCPCEFPLDKMVGWYFKRFLTGYRLLANDRSGMRYGLEVRTPFCDHHFVETALSIAPSFNLQGGTEKHALREAFKDILPTEIYRRRKYALPESKSILFYELMGKRLKEEINLASPDVWQILSKNYACKIHRDFNITIQEIKRGGENNFTKEIPLNQPVSMRLNHVFSILTFLRWFDMNFT